MAGFGFGLGLWRRRTPSFVGPLDGLGPLYAVPGPHRALSSYTGPCWRVRRSIDAGEEDVGFTPDGWVDKDWLLDVAGGGSLTAIRDYDKAGQGHDLVQLSSGSQPRCVLNGVVDVGPNGRPVLVYDGINDYMDVQDSAGFSRNQAALTYAGVVRNTTTGAVLYYPVNASVGSVRGYIGFSPGATAPLLQTRSTDVAANTSVAGAAITSGTWNRLIGRGRYAAGGADIAVNGAVVTNNTLTPAQNTPDTSQAANVRIGAATFGGAYLTGAMSTVVLAQAALDMAALEAALAKIMP